MDNIVKNSGFDWNDFFIVAITGSADFAAASFEQQIKAMQDYKDSFHYADNEEEGKNFISEHLSSGRSTFGIE